MDKNLIKELQAFLKTDQIITDKSSIQVYQRDGLSGYSGIPGMVLLPESEMISLKSLKFAISIIPCCYKGAGTVYLVELCQPTAQ